jgi:hypothetical protein
MYFPKFWQRAKTGDVVTWGWSDISEDDALKKAQERQSHVLALLRSGEGTLARYGYPDRPMREEVLREFRSPDGSVIATVSRNSVGCRVLNTDGLLFIDVDVADTSSGGSLLDRLLRRGQSDPQIKLEEDASTRAHEWVAANPDWRWHLYRTKGGIRLMAVHRPIPPSDPVVQRVFDTFNADPLYRRLCENQRCYRARLTPKPWRCGADRPPDRWPWKNQEAEQKFRVWDQQYTTVMRPFATCRFLGKVGGAGMASELREIVHFHDDKTGASKDLPLA